MKSASNYSFAQVPPPQVQRSVFNRRSTHKTTFDEGWLVPYFLDEILPGDTMSLKSTVFARLQTLQFPIMDNLYIDLFFFYVPARLLWEHWERFNGAQPNPGDSTDFLIPTIERINPETPIHFDQYDLGSYLGLPINDDLPDGEISALPFRAYNKIYNDWFRDENLEEQAPLLITDGPDPISLYEKKRRGKRHDYFTSALPWPQKGDAVVLPLGDTAPIYGTGDSFSGGDFTQGYGFGVNFTGAVAAYTDAVDVPAGTDVSNYAAATGKAFGVGPKPYNSGIYTDLSEATAASINTIRTAVAYQHVLEKDARGGTRYVEFLKSHFGVTAPDFRLMRAEYLGGSSNRWMIQSVPQTSANGLTPQGNLAAYGMASSSVGFHHSFVEHGYVIGLVNIRADMTYQNQIHKLWTRSTRFDFYLPALAHLGEQAILNKELKYNSLSGDANNDVFGYQERWAEYRYKNSIVSGDFNSNVSANLDAWHLALDFDTAPPLSAAFIEDEPPVERIMATVTRVGAHFLMDSMTELKHTRPMPVYSVPGLMRL